MLVANAIVVTVDQFFAAVRNFTVRFAFGLRLIVSPASNRVSSPSTYVWEVCEVSAIIRAVRVCSERDRKARRFLFASPIRCLRVAYGALFNVAFLPALPA